MSRIYKNLFSLIIAATVLIAAVGTVVYLYFSRDLPPVTAAAEYRPLGVTRVLSGDEKPVVLAEFFKERRYLINYDKIPKTLIQAFISAEDATFFQHQGVNIASMIRASLANFRAGHVAQGGSTITQQVAKSLLHMPERSMVRKIRELILAERIEGSLTKEEILYLYLNQIYLGHGAYGVEAACHAYFHKSATEATIAEAAMLAGLPQAPGKYSPLLNPKRAKERQQYVLHRMVENKYISAEVAKAAANEPIRIFDDEDPALKPGAYFIEHVRKYLVEKYSEKTVYEDALTVQVSMRQEMAASAFRALKDGLRGVDKRQGYRGAIKKLKASDEIEAYLKDEREQLVKGRLGFEIFMPDGTIDIGEAIRSAGMRSDQDLLRVGQVYEAVISSVDDRKKTAGFMLGGTHGEITWEGLRWARAGREDKGQAVLGYEPRVPSQVVAKGDVVLVRVSQVGEWGVKGLLEQDPKVQGALFSLDAQTGLVLAMEGGFDFSQSEFNRVTQGLRQPGSSFKPIIYSAALERGFTPTTIIVDSPIVYEDADNGKWKPSNFEEKFYGDTTFRQALIHSRNVPTIKIVQALQVPYVINYAKRLGLNGKFPSDLTVSLGSGGVSLWDLTRTYALFPRLGRQINPVFILSVKEREGRTLEEYKPVMDHRPIQAPAPSDTPTVQAEDSSANRALIAMIGKQKVQIPPYPPADDPEQVMDPRVASVMTHLMKEVVTFGTGQEAKALGRAAAGKTGTTNDSQDAWFMGFTPTVVTGTWVGFDSLRPIGPGETGARAALPIWLSFMKDAVKNYPDTDFTVPPGVVFASINPTNGKPAPPNASGSIKEAFIEGTEPDTNDSATSRSKPASQSNFFKEDIE